MCIIKKIIPARPPKNPPRLCIVPDKVTNSPAGSIGKKLVRIVFLPSIPPSIFGNFSYYPKAA